MKNEIEIIENVCYIKMRSKGKQYICLVDTNIYMQKLSNIKWFVNIDKNGKRHNVYVISKKGKMHRIIMDLGHSYYDKRQVDHINHNTLDNRLCNLRIATNAENNHNSRPALYKKASKYKGVHKALLNVYKIWNIHITINGKSKFLKNFYTEKAAALHYDIIIKKEHGDFAYLNFPNITPEQIKEIYDIEEQEKYKSIKKRQIKKRKNNKYTGISKRRNRWYCRVCHNNQVIFAKLYKTPEEAALAYNEVVKSYNLDRPLNIIED